MDLNQLYFEHQLLLMTAQRSPSTERRAFEAAATCLAGRIGSIQRNLGAGAAPAWQASAGVSC